MAAYRLRCPSCCDPHRQPPSKWESNLLANDGARARLPPVPDHHLSHRLPWGTETNRLTRAVGARTACRLPILDLTVSNPTRVGLPYPERELAEALARGAAAPYEPHPLGLPAARAGLAEALSRPGDTVDPDDLLLTASTSEAYAHLFRVLADPGDEVLTAVPGYPLLDDLAALDGLALRRFALETGRRFRLDPGELARAVGARTRMVVVVQPANPTGSWLTAEEQDAAAGVCGAHGLALVSDEVFADFPLAADAAVQSSPVHGGGGTLAGPAAARGDVLAFTLGGLSKSAGLPGWKLAWVRAGGPRGARRRAMEALAHAADTYLSVAGPVQHALAEVLALAPGIRAAILTRLQGNLAALRAALAPHPALDLVEPQGGWSAVLRVPRLEADEDLAVALLEEAGVLVHPGHYFDFPGDGWLVLSLLPPPEVFAEAVRRVMQHLTSR